MLRRSCRRLSQSVVEPKFWTGKNALPTSAFSIDCGGDLPQTPPSDFEALMKETYDKHGIVRLHNTGLAELPAMRTYADLTLKGHMKYEGGSNPRKGLAANVYEAGAPPAAWLHYHHEMAYNSHSLSKIGFSCSKATEGKGATFVSEQQAMTRAILRTELGQKLKDRGVCNIRRLTDSVAYDGRTNSDVPDGKPAPVGVFNHWQVAFQTDCPDEAEQRARDCGLEVSWGQDPCKASSDRYMITRNYLPAFEYSDDLDANIMYSSIADHNVWFDTWPGVMEVEPSQRPLQMTFGDDSPFSSDEIAEWVSAYDSTGVKVPWAVGDVVVLCNYRWAHGRPSYDLDLEAGEERELGVMLGPKFQRQGQREDGWKL